MERRERFLGAKVDRRMKEKARKSDISFKELIANCRSIDIISSATLRKGNYGLTFSTGGLGNACTGNPPICTDACFVESRLALVRRLFAQ